jgi:hypothetical protein
MRIASVALLILVLPGAASSQMVGIYSDSLASSCNLTIPFPGPPVDIFVVFTPGPMADSMGGGSFLIEGLPDGWSGEGFVNPDGDCSPWCSPFEWPGAQITFPACQSGAVVLYRLRLTPNSAVTDHELHVVAGANPGGLFCPRTFGCEDQAGTSLPHARALINSSTMCNQVVGGSCPWTDVVEFLPAETSLSIAPNPPRSKTTIHYSLAPGARFAGLSVYDLAGRLVAHILESTPAPSVGFVTWDGRDRSGASVGAGVYIVRLETDRTTVARKIVLIR